MFPVVATLNRKEFFSFFVAFIFFLATSNSEIKPCSPRNYGIGKTVCVCDETYCDSIGKITLPELGQVDVFETNSLGERFNRTTGNFIKKCTNRTESARVVTATINKHQLYQEILGFGGAFTDAAGINMNSLPLPLQQELINGYYSEEGLDYNIGRVPMASCDFSTWNYSYCDVPDDFNLVNFQLAQEDLKFKIPFMQQALNVSLKPLLFFGSPWSSPYWMKTNNQMAGGGQLKGNPGGRYYQTWADYFVKFLQAYEQHNISFWGLTAENEPTEGFMKNYSFQCLGFTPEMQRDFIKLNLGPTLKFAGYGPDKIKLMILDDQRIQLPKWAEVVFEDSETADYISGIAFHWYTNSVAPPKLLDLTHQKFPDKFLLSTEACTGTRHQGVDLGNWSRAEQYAYDIIEDLQHFTVGWVDWNLALDLQGGPNWVKNFVDSPIVVNATGKEFYRQPMYYALGHFSKFLPKGSFRIGLDAQQNTALELAAFKRPDDSYVLIAVNRGFADVILIIRDPDIGHFSYNVTSHSVQSYIWRNNY